jgi:chromate transporter
MDVSQPDRVPPATMIGPGALPSLASATRVWARIGCLSFGGPAGQIALMHREVVEGRRWIGERRFLHALNFCHLLPGPEAQQLAIYLGWLMHGPIGGFVAGTLFVIPGALVMLALSIVYVTLGSLPIVAAAFHGLECAVLVIVFEALLRVGRRALKTRSAWILAAAALVALFVFGVPFPLVVAVAASIGFVFPDHFAKAAHGSTAEGEEALVDVALAADPGRAARLARGARRAGLIALALWLVPVGIVVAIGGRYGDIGWFFSKMALVTFGGAYAVLSYAAQDAVGVYGWLAPAEMMSGLGLAETTPGPLILVLQFVGFLAGFRSPNGPAGIAGGVLASLLTLWATFVPCFAFVFLGAPVIEQLHGRRALGGALAAVTSAVVGVVANLAFWFALHVLFRQTASGSLALPTLGSIDPGALALVVVAAVAMFGLRLGVARVLALAAMAGIVLAWATTRA